MTKNYEQKKKFTLMGTILLCVVLMTFESTHKSNVVNDELALLNVEALSANENDDEFKCALSKDNCKFTISTKAQLYIIKKVLKMMDLTIGAEVDLTNATKIYREKYIWEKGVRCGSDVTCNDVLNQLNIM